MSARRDAPNAVEHLSLHAREASAEQQQELKRDHHLPLSGGRGARGELCIGVSEERGRGARVRAAQRVGGNGSDSPRVRSSPDQGG